MDQLRDLRAMLSGFNTDVVHQNTVYHVQTEDKGRSNPIIESLVYVGGQVVVSKREEYADLLDQDAGDQSIADRMDRQHQVLIAAIKSGRLDGQLETLFESEEVMLAPPGSSTADAIFRAVDELGIAESSELSDSRAEKARRLGEQIDEDASFDEVVLRYLNSEATREHLVLALEEDGEIEMGRKAFLALRASSSQSGEAIDGAAIVVRMISTVRQPEVLIEGMTDEDGECFLNVQIPALAKGSAALIISASSGIGNAELKQLL